MKNGLQQLINFMEKRGLHDEPVEAVSLFEGNGDEDYGLLLWAEAVPVLERHSIERGYSALNTGNWDLPPIMLRVWLKETIIYNHEYDSSLDIRTMPRNPS